LYEGIQKVKIVFDGSGFNLNFVELKDPQLISSTDTKISNAATSVNGYSILIYLNKKIDQTVPLNLADYSVKIGTSAINPVSVSFNPNTPNGIILNIPQLVVYGNAVKVSFSGTTLKTEDGSVLPTVTDVAVTNSTPFRTTIPAKIEAEKYLSNSGLSAEDCTDIGLGQNMGYTDNGDYLDYLIFVPSDGTYSFEYRIASAVTGGSIELRMVDDPKKPVVIHTVSVPNTGGWKTWKSVTASGILSQGPHTLRIYVKQAQFNINWFKIALVTGLNDMTRVQKFDVYPNPATDIIMVNPEGINGDFLVRLVNLQGFAVKEFNRKFNFGTAEQFDISDCVSGFYILSIENQSSKYHYNIIKASN
jgi:hypothetical protein